MIVPAQTRAHTLRLSALGLRISECPVLGSQKHTALRATPVADALVPTTGLEGAVGKAPLHTKIRLMHQPT
jgi:hypothetical protein